MGSMGVFAGLLALLTIQEPARGGLEPEMQQEKSVYLEENLPEPINLEKQ